MTRRCLRLVRHAKSSWDDPSLDDHDRPLSDRGRRASLALAWHLSEAAASPQIVLCSSARRAVDTATPLAAELPSETLVVDPRLYTFDADAVRARISEVPADVTDLMIVGHNPAMERFAVWLTGDAAVQRFPTGALATIALAVRWDTLRPRSGRVESFVTPRDLARHQT
jgi:phosphohistidine phosphatase